MTDLQTSSAAAVFERSTKPNAKRPAPFSMRFTDEERARLDRDAGNRSWASYIREQLFGDEAAPRRSGQRKPQKPTADGAAIARALGELGRSRLASNMNQIAKAANMGALPVTPELAQELNQACADIRLIRRALIIAAGLKE